MSEIDIFVAVAFWSSHFLVTETIFRIGQSNTYLFHVVVK